MADGSADEVIGRGMTAEVRALSDTRVLKLFNAGISRERVEGEYAHALAAADAGIPTPTPLGLDTVDDRFGIVFERVDAPTLLEELGRRPWSMFAVARSIARLSAEVGDIEAPGIRSVREFLRARLQDAELADEVRAKLLLRLDALPGGYTLCHLDLHPGNILAPPSGPVVIDWANACCGDHAADAAQTMLILQCASVPPGTKLAWHVRAGRAAFCRLVRRELTRRDPTLGARIDEWLPVLAGARLAERNEGERDRLLAVVGNPA